MSLRLSLEFEIWAFNLYRPIYQLRSFDDANACFQDGIGMLRQIRCIRRSVTRPVLQSLVAALNITRLDYGCSTMAGLPARQKLDSSRCSMLPLDSSTQPGEPSTCHRSSVSSTAWLRVQQRIEFSLAYRCLNGTAPQCFVMGYSEFPTSAGAVGSVLRRWRYFTKQSVTGPSPSQSLV